MKEKWREHPGGVAMEEDRFDRIARILAVAPSRRQILGYAVGGLAVGGLAGLGNQAASDARKKGKKKKKCGPCGECRTCVNGVCKPKPNGVECGDGDICQDGVCGCDAGFEPCGDACVETCAGGQALNANCLCVCTTQSCAGCCDGNACLPVGASQSAQKCGSGGAACAPCGTNEECAQGACECVAGFERCQGDCVQSCSGDKVLNGSCRCACPGSTQDCGGNVCKTCCDDAHCGDQVCCSGECRDCCDDDDCDGDRTCQNQTCLCPSGREACGDVCCAARKVCADAESSLCVTGRGTCEVGANICTADDGASCNAHPDCFCVLTVGGETRCVQNTPQTACGQCDADADCAAFGPGAVCADSTGPHCCLNDAPNGCHVPCAVNPPGACAAGADSCILGQAIHCNGRADCFCLQHQGEARCLGFHSGAFACDECESDADCAEFGEGAVCYIPSTPCICLTGQGICMLDCPELDFVPRASPRSGPGAERRRPRQSRRTAGRTPRRREGRKKRR